MKIGLAIPNCREGAPYPLEFATPTFIHDVAVEAERLGYYSLWANDHLVSTPPQVKDLPHAPHYYEPLITQAYLAAATSRVKLVIATIVPGLREPALFAKQVASLDRLADGRLILGLGLGSQRDEFEALAADPKANRGRMMDEFIVVVRRLLDEQRGGHAGTYYRVGDVHMQPGPAQMPFPIYLSGVAGDAIERVARVADGWIISTHEQTRGIPAMRAIARAAGRDADAIDVAYFGRIAIGVTEDVAQEAWQASMATRATRQRGTATSAMLASRPRANASAKAHPTERDLIGTPAQISEQLREFEARGVDHVGLIFLAQRHEELIESARLFAREVLPRFA